jgi:hypothetical protein
MKDKLIMRYKGMKRKFKKCPKKFLNRTIIILEIALKWCRALNDFALRDCLNKKNKVVSHLQA